MIDELNACPMCGSRDLLLDSERKFGERGFRGLMYCVMCQECGAQGPWADTEKIAMEAWNMMEDE
jgi:Lar family restriction alleviation protein